MKIGISINRGMNDYFSDERMVKEFARIGYNCIDYGLFYDQGNHVRGFIPEIFLPEEEFTAYFTNLRKMIESYGMTVSQTHSAFPLNDIEGYATSDEMIEGLKRSIKATALLGAKYVVIHAARYENVLTGYNVAREKVLNNTKDVYKKLIPTLEENDVYVGVENLFRRDDLQRPIPCPVSYPDQIISLIKEMNSDRFVACLDTGHLLLTGGDCAHAVREYGPLLKILHVHDNDKYSDQHTIPTEGNGDIKIDWPDFVSALLETGYDGVFSLEIDGAIYRAADVTPDLMFDYCDLAYKISRSLLGGAK